MWEISVREGEKNNNSYQLKLNMQTPKKLYFQGYTFLWCSLRICFRLNSTLGKAFFTRPVRTVSRRSNTFWSSGQSVKCRFTTLVRNSIISMRSMECPAHISNSSRRAKTRISSSFVYNSFFFCSIICCFESAEEKSFQLQCRRRRNEFKAMTEGLFWGGGEVDGEEEDVLRRINFGVTVYSTFFKGDWRGDGLIYACFGW